MLLGDMCRAPQPYAESLGMFRAVLSKAIVSLRAIRQDFDFIL